MGELQSNSPLLGTDTSTVETLDLNTKMYTETDENGIEETGTGVFAILVVCAAAVGGFMFGYDTACISSILLFLDQSSSFDLSAEEKELVTGITSVGSFFGSIGTSHMADKFGRKRVITICCVVFTFAAVQLSLVNTVLAMVVGRFIVGLAVGSASMVVPVYISEIAPSKIRGRLLVLNSLTTTGGQLVSNFVAYFIANQKNNWRLMFFLSGIPSLLFLIISGFMPESPRYLVLANNYSDAEMAVAKLYPNATHSQVHSKVVSIMDDIQQNQDKHDLPVHIRLFGESSTKRALAVGCALMFYQQISSFNSFMYYGATIFKSVGVGNPLIVSILISGTNFMFTFVALRYIDKVGRRNMLLRTVWIMGVALLISAFAFFNVGDPSNNNGWSSILLIASVLLFVASYASALGTIPWSSVEFLPLESRAPGSAMIAATGWLTNSVVSATYLSMVKWISLPWTCSVFASICLAGWFAIKRWYPEVNGLSLEEIRHVFANGIDINYAEKLKRQENDSLNEEAGLLN
uniref:MFS transporter n=1 Tax=Cyberlindnera americana TaxID=36016 RepID=A0A5P8N8C2_9ASCO|nr:MFS transporter [Cyberlindnera americana]